MAGSLYGSLEETQVALNPWNGRGSALGINLGDPARVLTVGRKYGLLPATSVQVPVPRKRSYVSCGVN